MRVISRRATFITKDVITQIKPTARVSFQNLYICWALLAVTFIACVACLLFTYNWYIAGLNDEIQKTPFDRHILGDQFTYRKHMGKMKHWGWLSWTTGWITGFSLLAGLVFFVLGSIDLLSVVSPS